MARPWRLRHKLLLGLGLVVGTLALLLAGSLQGLSASVATMRSNDAKLVELRHAEELRRLIEGMLVLPERDLSLNDQKKLFQQRSHAAHEALVVYQAYLQDSIARRRDPDKGVLEGMLDTKLEAGFADLTRALDKVAAEVSVSSEPSIPDLGKQPDIEAAHRQLILGSEGLLQAICSDLFHSIARAKRQYNYSLIIVLTASGLAVFFIGCLVYFFSSWFFQPIRRLQEGVNRVAQGHFDHAIVLRSGDELQELADAFNDMTRRVRVTYDDLSRQVEDRSRQLVRSERLVSVGFLAAGVAHEINNPLASIAFCSEALESRLAPLLRGITPADAETIAKYLKMMQQEAFRCKDITQRLLEFSRVGDRKREPTDLAGLIQSVLEMAQHLPNCKGKQIVFQPYTRPLASVNSPEISSVVLNLVVNALDSMDEGGELTIALQVRGGSVEIEFRDAGCGMPPEVLENIFEPFYTRSKTGKGTGLGLSISHQIIAQHGGEIEATSAGVNRGSTFVVRLPLNATETAGTAPRAVAA